jgi:sRNA-binding regulator protein Hfq
MSTEGNTPHSKNLFLLTLKDKITVHFVDGQTLEGEFATQDELNIFVMVDNEPMMIPRSQIRYIKGKQGQPIEKDDSQGTLAGAGVEESILDTKEKRTPPAELEGLEDDDMTVVLADEDEELGETMVIDEAAIAGEGITTSQASVLEEAPFTLQEVGIGFEEDEDPTLVFKEEQAGVDDLEEDTFVLEEEKPEAEENSAYLDCTSGPHAGEMFPLKSGITTIGRANDNVLPLSNDKEISRRHSRIMYEAGSFIVEDQGSLNGTFVNDGRIESPHYLEDGDVIFVGISTLVFREK